MLSPVSNIAFNGVYDLVFPSYTPDDKIESKTVEIQNIIKNNIPKGFDAVKLNNRIRIITAYDNPNVIMNLFEAIGGENLAKQYLRRNIQEYRLDIQA